MLDDQTIKQCVSEIVRDVGRLAGDIRDIPDEGDLYAELGVASVNAIAILLALEERFATTIDDNKFVRARSVKQLVELVQDSQEALCKQSA